MDRHENVLGWRCRYTAPGLETAKRVWGVREITTVVTQFEGEMNACKKSRCAIPQRCGAIDVMSVTQLQYLQVVWR